MRTAVAVRAGRAAAAISRRVGAGDGTVIGGRVTLGLDPAALRRLAAGRWISLVSGTNGKTTTTRMLTAALRTAGAAVTNPQGSNLPPGLVAGLAVAQPGDAAALEVDEAWLGKVAAEVHPASLTLLNLSRDQLDRVAEVRKLADRWRLVVAAHRSTPVVANADDPLVVWAASGSSDAGIVTWVGAGQPWVDDAAGCPACGGRIEHPDPSSPAHPAPPPDGPRSAAPTAGWRCSACAFQRPRLNAWVNRDQLVVGEQRWPIELALPGRANRANAAMAALTARLRGVDIADALGAMREIADVDGRYLVTRVGGADARILLAKNPAGWLEVFDMLRPAPTPVVVVINARIADGRDPSWLWDVPFERLAGRRVVASGERSRDLAVRLDYAGVDNVRVDDPLEGIGSLGPGPVDVGANYTAMRALDRRVRGSRAG